MAIVNYSSSFLFLLLSTVHIPLLLYSCSEKVEAYKFNETAADLHQHQTHHFISLSSLMPSTVCSTPAQGSKNLSGILEVTHKYGPCSPFRKKNAKIPSLRQILIDDQNRVNSIHSKIYNKNPLADSTVSLPASSGQPIGAGAYVVNIGIGTSKQDFTVVFDTGSDLTWIQCQPCDANQCHTQQHPYFNPSASSTYSNIPCASNACSQLQSLQLAQPSCTTNCLFQVQYGDQSYSKGEYVTDTVTLSSSDVFPNFQFGCAHTSKGTFGSLDGLLGLGQTQISMVSQTAKTYGKLFSYCLPATSSSPGFLAFGSQVGSSSSLQYTPLGTDSNHPTFYFLNMIGISVEGQMLSIPEPVFANSGTIIDSGTTITSLAATAYSALQSAFRQGMSKYHTAPSPYPAFDTCYDFSGFSNITIPTIVLHFGGGTDLNVDPSGILVHVSPTVYCLAFAGNRDDTNVAILGNKQQQTYEVVYDVAGQKLGFGAGACS